MPTVAICIGIGARIGMPAYRMKEDRPRPEASALPQTSRPRSQGAPALLSGQIICL